MQKPSILIGIVDDHSIFRKGLIRLIHQFDNCRVVLEVGNGIELQEELKKEAVPDIILLDLRMPLMNGHEILDWLQKHYPSIQVIILSMYDSDYNIIRLLKAGAKAFLNKNIESEELQKAIHSVMEKGFYYTNSITRKLFNVLYNNSGIEFDFRSYILSEKESLFMQLVISELTYKEIAKEMNISPRAVDKIRDRMFFRFDTKNRVSLAMKSENHF